jgi:hypothetical protein
MRSYTISTHPQRRYIQLVDGVEFWRFDLTCKRHSDGLWRNICAWSVISDDSNSATMRILLHGAHPFISPVHEMTSGSYRFYLRTLFPHTTRHLFYPVRFGQLVMYEKVEREGVPTIYLTSLTRR